MLVGWGTVSEAKTGNWGQRSNYQVDPSVEDLKQGGIGQDVKLNIQPGVCILF